MSSPISPLKKRSQEVKQTIETFCRENNILNINLQSQLIRPLISFEVARHLSLDEKNIHFLYGTLAIQTVHEASLLHDDIIDKGEVRRGKTTTLNHENINEKLMQGDLFIAQSFDFIIKTQSLKLIEYYNQCNLNVIKGELFQNKKRGQTLNWQECCAINKWKTGSLFASAAAVPVFLAKTDEKAKKMNHSQDFLKVMSEVGMIYQMLDDLLDYIPDAQTGKTPLKDFHQKKPTFLMLFYPEIDWSKDEDIRVKKLTRYCKENNATKNPLEQAVKKFHEEAEKIKEKLTRYLDKKNFIFDLMQSWQQKLEHSVETAKKNKTFFLS